MTWVRSEDDVHEQPKIRKAWRRWAGSVGLLWMSLAYSNRHRTDGFIDPEWVELQLLAAVDPDDPPEEVAVMVDCGLWVQMNGGWEIHPDYLQYQPSAADVERVAELRRIAGALGGKAKAAKRREQP